MDRLAAMRTFVEIIDRGSLTAAAEALDRSTPTVVRTLARLEELLGARLLQRTTRRQSLTPEGRQYLERCRRILADVEEAEAVVGGDHGEPQGLLRITAPVQFGQMHVAPVLTGFLRRHPRVQLELLLLDRNVDLVDEGIDLAVRIGELADSSMLASRVGQVRRVLCAAPRFLERDGVPGHPGHLHERPCVRFVGLGSGRSWRFVEGQRDIAVPVEGTFASNQVRAVIQACVDGLGFGSFLSYQVEGFLADGRLRLVLEEFEPAPLPVSLVYPETRFVSSRLGAVRDWLKATLPDRLARLAV